MGLVRRTATVLVTVAGALGISAPISSAAPSLVKYVALGDSYSSGQGSGPYIPGSGDCRRAASAYPVAWAHSRTTRSLRFAACSGATTSTVMATQLGALSRATTLVTLTAGGNDTGWTNALARCAVTIASRCASSAASVRKTITATVPAELDELFRAIRARAPHARVVVLGYPHLFESDSRCGLTGVLFSRAERATLNGVADLLDTTIQRRAKAVGFTFADVRSRFAGHGICGRNPRINDTLNVLHRDPWVHPNASGQSAYAAALRAVT
jgi:lysophospholipase L1-like esterase